MKIKFKKLVVLYQGMMGRRHLVVPPEEKLPSIRAMNMRRNK
jgi:hypothetical protein